MKPLINHFEVNTRRTREAGLRTADKLANKHEEKFASILEKQNFHCRKVAELVFRHCKDIDVAQRIIWTAATELFGEDILKENTQRRKNKKFAELFKQQPISQTGLDQLNVQMRTTQHEIFILIPRGDSYTVIVRDGHVQLALKNDPADPFKLTAVENQKVVIPVTGETGDLAITIIDDKVIVPPFNYVGLDGKVNPHSITMKIAGNNRLQVFPERENLHITGKGLYINQMHHWEKEQGFGANQTGNILWEANMRKGPAVKFNNSNGETINEWIN